MVKELHSTVLDKKKWDERVLADPEGRVYALSWFLDAVTGNDWSGLVDGDYATVMPFVSKKKYGMRYAYMPFLVQQFSLYGDKNKGQEFISYLRSLVRFAELRLSFSESLGTVRDLTLKERSNFVLTLDKPYDALQKAYSSNHKRNLQKYNSMSMETRLSEDIAPLCVLYRKMMSGQMTTDTIDKVLKSIKAICNSLEGKEKATILYSTSQGEVVGGALFLLSNDTLYYLLGASKKEMEYKGVLFGLIDHVIKEHASSSYALDFEGSDISGIARFFKGFGATRESYSSVKWNDLPFFIKWFKK